MENKLEKIIAIVGTNASGKSSLSLKLAQTFGGEIISADSRQLYKGFDLCSGKVTAEEKKIVPHYMIDSVDISEDYSLAKYQAKTYDYIYQIIEKDKTPFLVGGTGLYLKAIIDGYHLIDVAPNPEFRKELENMDREALVDVLAGYDKEVLTKIDTNNKIRIIRAIEVYKNGYSFDDMRKAEPKFEALQIGITWEREVLYQRIDERLRRRLDQGMVEEVASAIDEGVSKDKLDKLGLEYRYVLKYLDGEITSLEELYEKLRFAIHRYARRQLTWFRKEKSVHWLDTSGNYVEEAEDLIKKFLEKK